MTSIATIALIFIMQGGTQFPQARETTGPRDVATPQDRQFIEATPERAEAYVRNEFEVWDRDYSQFIELEEAPSQVTGPYNGPLEGDEARRSFVSTIDADGDGKVSFDEFAAKMMPNVLEQGIPLIPADEVQVSFIRGERDDSQLDSYLGRGRVTPTPVEMRLILAASFARIDADGSGYLEGRETPVTEPPGPVPVLDMDEEGKLFETGETITRTDGELRDNFYRDADTDGDGRISRDEYDKWAIEQTHRSGINPESRQAMNAPLDPQS